MPHGLKFSKTFDRLTERMRTAPFPYQVRGVRFLERAGGRGVVADDPGLGKTWQSMAWAALHREARPVVVVCPATVKYNWRREWRQHAGLRARILSGELTTPEQDREKLAEKIKKSHEELSPRAAVRAIRAYKQRQRAGREEQARKVRRARRAKIIIVNYDVLDSWLPVLLIIAPKLLIIDECHFCKSPSSLRTKSCKKLAKACPHVIALSGTPIAARPSEFFPVLQMVRPDAFPSFWKFAFEFCNPKRNHWSGDWDFSGASHLDRLRERLKGVMIRRLKKNVLKDLPEKVRTVIPIDIDNRAEYAEAEAEFLKWLLKKKGQIAHDRAARAEAIVRIGQLKQLAAHGKMRIAIRWVREWLEGGDQKMIIFAIHKTIIAELQVAFPRVLVIDGSVAAKERQRRVDEFQTTAVTKDARRRAAGDGILIGQLQAAGVGLNLTAASNVLFLELGWGPNDHTQAEDRAYRIGTKAKVSVYYLVGRRTIEVRVLSIIQAKDDVVARVLDGRKGGGVMRLLKSYLARA